MDTTPLYIICSEQGVPIPNTVYDFVISLDELQNFEVAKVKIGQEETRVKEAFILGITKDNALSMSLINHVDELHDSVAEIGLFCELLSVEEGSPSDKIIRCKVLCRALIKEITYEDRKSYAKVFLLSEKATAVESETTRELKEIIYSLVKASRSLSKRNKAKILASNSITYMSNVIVGELSNDEDERFNYLQSKDNLYNFIYAIKTLLVDAVEDDFPKKGQGNYASDFESLFDSIKSSMANENSSKEDSLSDRVKKAKVPEGSRSKINSELARLEKLPSGSLEYQALSEYLSWIADLPWGKCTSETPDLNELIDILNQSHYGLDEVKEHILEYLTIQKITGDPQGTVLCFVGEPGTGKTSIAKQIAKACNREIIKIALGGMGDEAELRGHRRTYVASRPGRIVSGIKSCGTMDPLILLDEVDKIDVHRGDPTSALLELLDPEQNNEFIDRYIEVPIDISSALFVATANYLEKIPPPLRDRMEIINFRNYTPEEKKVILDRFVVPSAMKQYGLSEMNIEIDPNVIEQLVEKDGIREIKRRLLKLLRKAAVKIVVKKEDHVLIDRDFMQSIKVAKGENKKIGF